MDELILMIFKTHQGEWLTPRRVAAIVNAIKGTAILQAPIKRALGRLTKKGKILRMVTDYGPTFTFNNAMSGFFL